MKQKLDLKKFFLFALAGLCGSAVIAVSAFATVFYLAPCMLPDAELNADCYCRGGKVEATGNSTIRLTAGGKAACIKLNEAEYSETDLKGVDLEGADIVDSNFHGSNLIAANLRSVNMTATDFSDADLRVIDATIANFTNADLSHANLSGSRFIGAKLKGANLDEAKLLETDFTGSDLSNTDMEGVVAKYAIFSNAKLFGADLARANFHSADFSYADMRDVDLSSANWYHAQISGAQFDDVFDIRARTLASAWAWSDRLPQGLPSHARLTVCDAKFRERYEDTKRRGRPKYGCRNSAPFDLDDNSISEIRRDEGVNTRPGKFYSLPVSDLPSEPSRGGERTWRRLN